MWPHRRQPTRLCRPWDSPGKNIRVGCHFLLPCVKVKSESEVAQSCPTLSDPMDCSLPGSSIHGIFQARVLEWGAIAFSLQVYNDTKKADGSLLEGDTWWLSSKGFAWSTGDIGDADSIHGSGRSLRAWQPTPVLLPGRSHGQRSLSMGSQRVGHNWSDWEQQHKELILYLQNC